MHFIYTSVIIKSYDIPVGDKKKIQIKVIGFSSITNHLTVWKCICFSFSLKHRNILWHVQKKN